MSIGKNNYRFFRDMGKKHTQIFKKIKIIFRRFNVSFDEKKLVRDLEQENYILKTRVRDNKEREFLFKYKITNLKAESFEKEILFHQKRDNDDCARGKVQLQKFAQASLDADNQWLLLNYAPGETLGNAFAIDAGKLKNRVVRELLLEAPFFIHSIQNTNWVKMKKDGTWMLRELRENKNIFLKYIGALEYKLIEKLIIEKFNWLNQHSYYLCHRDNHPGNFIFNEEKSILTIIDWTDICLSNRMYDFTDIWLHSWQSPKAQREYLDEFLPLMQKRYKIKNNEHIESFNLTALILLLQEFVYLDDRKKIDWAFGGKKWTESWRNRALKIHYKNFADILKNYESKTIH